MRVTKLVVFLAAVVLLHSTRMHAQDFGEFREQVAALGDLTDAPSTYPATGFQDDGQIKAIYYDALPWKGNPTRVFAWIGIPSNGDADVPGVVLVHGGGGTAFKEWVQKWNDIGYAAISIAVEGQTDVRLSKDPPKGWKRHPMGGPPRDGIYGDSAEPLADQWMYHAVANTVLANSLLRSQAGVDASKVGLMGISWGGVITSTVIGIDNRFAFAIPTYGCGDLADVPNQYGRALGDNLMYRNVWDPMLRMSNATMPTLWLSWTEDTHFPLDAQHNCYDAAPAPHMVVLRPKMRHSHAAGWNPPDSYAFAQSVIEQGTVWCRQTEVSVDQDRVRVRFSTSKPIDSAVLTATPDTGMTNERTWTDHKTTIMDQADGTVTVQADLPKDTTAWFINLKSGDLYASSDYQQTQ